MFSHALPAVLETTAAGRWFAERVMTNNAQILEHDQLTDMAAVDRRKKIIWVPRDSDFGDVHHWGCRGVLYLRWGAEWAPEFELREHRVAHGGGVVLPFHRPPYASGQWRH